MADTISPSLGNLPTTRRAILFRLKRDGELRAEDLAGELGITVSGVRQHLSGLMGDGYVTFREAKGGAGRPKHLYSLTAAAEGLFPKRYGDLTNELLDYARDADPALVERLFERRRDRRLENAQARLAGLPFDEQVAELTRILDEDGYLADAEPMGDGGWRIVEHNCAILDVALRYGQACSSEIDFLRAALPDADIERVSHMVAGARHCTYEVRPR